MSEENVKSTVLYTNTVTAQDLYLGSKRELAGQIKAAAEAGLEDLETKLKNPAYRKQIKELGKAPARELLITVTLIEADPQTEYEAEQPKEPKKAAAPAASASVEGEPG